MDIEIRSYCSPLHRSKKIKENIGPKKCVKGSKLHLLHHRRCKILFDEEKMSCHRGRKYKQLESDMVI